MAAWNSRNGGFTGLGGNAYAVLDGTKWRVVGTGEGNKVLQRVCG